MNSCLEGAGNPLERLRIISPGEKNKPDIHLALCGQRKCIIKDYSGSPWFLRPLARLMVDREIRILQRLSFTGQVPRYYGRVCQYSFVMEYVPGEHMPLQGIDESGFFYKSGVEFIETMHRVGILHNDLHRSNVIANPQRGLVFIDFVSAFIVPPWMRLFPPANWLVRELEQADIFHIYKYKMALTTEPLTIDEAHVVEAGRPFSSITRLWKKLFRSSPVDFSAKPTK